MLFHIQPLNTHFIHTCLGGTRYQNISKNLKLFSMLKTYCDCLIQNEIPAVAFLPEAGEVICLDVWQCQQVALVGPASL